MACKFWVPSLFAIMIAPYPVGATPIENPELPTMAFDSWEGYNPYQHASQETADELAELLGGAVVETHPISAPGFIVPPQRLIYLGGGSYLNAGLVAVTLMNNPYEVAMQMIMMDAYSSGSAFGREDVGFQIWDPFAASFITPLSLPDAIGAQLFNGSTLLGTSGTEDVAELKSFLMFAWGLIAIGALAHMLKARRNVHPNDTNCT